MRPTEPELRALVRETISVLKGRNPDTDLAGFVDAARARLPYADAFGHLRSRPGFRPGPDVVLLGLARTGTSWLFWHLFNSGRVVRTPYKEVNFLKYQGRFSNRYFAVREGVRNWDDYARQFVAQADQWIDAGMHDLTLLAVVHLLGRRNWSWFETVLGGIDGQASLDLTPGNVRMPAHVARKLARAYPHTRFAIFLRHPVTWARSIITRSPNPSPVVVTHERAGGGLRSLFRPLAEDVPRTGPYDIRHLLFGRQLARIARETGRVDVFLFEDLQRDPPAFMQAFSARYGLDIAAHPGMAAPIHESAETKAITFTPAAIAALADDIRGLEGFVPDDTLDRWLSDISNMRDGGHP